MNKICTGATKLAQGTVIAQARKSDAEDIIILLESLHERSEILKIEAANKLSCVTVESALDEEKRSEPHPLMSPIFYDMFTLIKGIERHLSETQRSVSNAQLPEFYNE